MGRVGAAIVGMELVALIVAVLAFGWPVLLVGVPLFVVTVVALVVVRTWEALGQRRWEQRRAAQWDQAAAQQGGLMSGFFAVSAIPEQPPLPPVDLPPFVRSGHDRFRRAMRELTRPPLTGRQR